MIHKSLRTIPVVIVLAYVVIVLVLCHRGLGAFSTLLITYGRSMFSVWLMVGLCALLVTLIRRNRDGASVSAWSIASDFIRSRWREDRLVSLFLPFLCFVPLITAYNIFKALYLPTAGFWAGRYIAQSERALLGGYDAWQITHSILAGAWATQVIDFFYHGWFLPMVVGVAICSYLRPDSRIGWRYLTSYVLLFSVQGTLIAFFVPAAGPALHGTMHQGSSKFEALNDTLKMQDMFLRLHGSPGLFSIETQHGLVTLFGQSSVAIGSGISAMPSLHNALAVLFACAAWSIGRRAGIVATAYAFLIWFGSVHLGWHYALDGVVGCALTVLTWIGVGQIPALFERRYIAAEAVPKKAIIFDPDLTEIA